MFIKASCRNIEFRKLHRSNCKNIKFIRYYIIFSQSPVSVNAPHKYQPCNNAIRLRQHMIKIICLLYSAIIIQLGHVCRRGGSHAALRMERAQSGVSVRLRCLHVHSLHMCAFLLATSLYALLLKADIDVLILVSFLP